VDGRFENLEVDVRILREDVSRLESKMDNKLEDLSIKVNEIQGKMSSSKAYSVDQHPSSVVSPTRSRHNPFPQIYLDVVFEGIPSCSGRIVIKLYDDLSPNNCKNFRGLLARSKEGLKGSRIVGRKGDTYVWGGTHDISNFMKSAINPSSEWFTSDLNELPYDKPGLLRPYGDSSSPKRNSSGFRITLQPETKWNNQKNGPFGEIVSGLDILRKIKANYGSESRSSKVVIADCGTLD